MHAINKRTSDALPAILPHVFNSTCKHNHDARVSPGRSRSSCQPILTPPSTAGITSQCPRPGSPNRAGGVVAIAWAGHVWAGLCSHQLEVRSVQARSRCHTWPRHVVRVHDQVDIPQKTRRICLERTPISLTKPSREVWTSWICQTDASASNVCDLTPVLHSDLSDTNAGKGRFCRGCIWHFSVPGGRFSCLLLRHTLVRRCCSTATGATCTIL